MITPNCPACQKKNTIFSSQLARGKLAMMGAASSMCSWEIADCGGRKKRHRETVLSSPVP
jgi:hypothetical protein